MLSAEMQRKQMWSAERHRKIIIFQPFYSNSSTKYETRLFNIQEANLFTVRITSVYSILASNPFYAPCIILVIMVSFFEGFVTWLSQHVEMERTFDTCITEIQITNQISVFRNTSKIGLAFDNATDKISTLLLCHLN